MHLPYASAPTARPLDADEARVVRAWLDRKRLWARVRRLAWLPFVTGLAAAIFDSGVSSPSDNELCGLFLGPPLVWAWVKAMRVAPGSSATSVSMMMRGLRRVTGVLQSGWRPAARSHTVAVPSHWPLIDGEVEALVFAPVTVQGDAPYKTLRTPLVLEARVSGDPPRTWSVGDDVRTGRVRADDVVFRLGQ